MFSPPAPAHKLLFYLSKVRHHLKHRKTIKANELDFVFPVFEELRKTRGHKRGSELVGSLFNDAFSVTRLYTADDMMTCEWWIGKDLIGSGRGLIVMYYPAFAWRDWGNPRETSIRIAGRRGRDWTRGPPKYEAIVLTTRPRHSVTKVWGQAISHNKDFSSL
jgi:hypothetical protein